MSLSRKERRAAERASRKAERRQLAAAAPAVGFVSHKDTAPTVGFVSHESISEARLEANRANADERTGRLLPVVGDSNGPRTTEGKAKSRENSFKHGLYSKQLTLKGEDAAELTALKATLFNEHQPATETEALLVQELAEHYWLMHRYRRFETQFLNLDQPQPREAETAQRMHSRAERSFYKALKTLRELQKERKREERTLGEGRAGSHGRAVGTGFVPTKIAAAANGFVPTQGQSDQNGGIIENGCSSSSEPTILPPTKTASDTLSMPSGRAA